MASPLTTIAVFGATGAQGNAVVRSLLAALKHPSWKVIGLTRDKNNDKAKALASLGVQLRECDASVPSSIDSALEGTHGVFCVTDFWASGNAEKETQQGKHIIDSAKKAGVRHFVYSSLEDTEKISGGAISVPHFVSKAKAEEHLAKSGLSYTVVEPAAYYENWKKVIRPGKDGVLELTLPIPGDSKFASYSVADTGLVVEKIFSNPEQYQGKKIALVGENLSADELVAAVSKHIGKPVRFNSVPPDVFATFPFPGAGEMAIMFDWFHKYGYLGEKKTGRDLWEGKKIAPLRTLEQFLKEDWTL